MAIMVEEIRKTIREEVVTFDREQQQIKLNNVERGDFKKQIFLVLLQ